MQNVPLKPRLVPDYDYQSEYYSFFFRRSVLRYLLEEKPDSYLFFSKRKVYLQGLKTHIPKHKKYMIKRMIQNRWLLEIGKHKYSVNPDIACRYYRIFKKQVWDPFIIEPTLEHQRVYEKCGMLWKTASEILELGSQEKQNCQEKYLIWDLVCIGLLEVLVNGQRVVERVEFFREPSVHMEKRKQRRLKFKKIDPNIKDVYSDFWKLL